jgi:hypothetical protein
MKKLIAYVIVIFFLNNLLVSQNINSKGFYIKEIVENCPWGEPEEYRFPLLKGSPDSIVKKINDNFILNFLDLDVDSMKSSVFENVWGTKENRMWGLHSLTDTLNTLNNHIYSITMYGEGCGAYCENFDVSYNYDLNNGNNLELADFFTSEGSDVFLKLLINKKQIITQEAIIFVYQALEDTNLDDEDKEWMREQMFIYSDCFMEYDNLKHIDFKIKNNKIILSLGRCSAYVNRALDDLGDFVFTYTIQELQPLLSEYGKGLLNK